MSLQRAEIRIVAARCITVLAAAVLLSVGKLAAAKDVAPQLMPPHPNLFARLQAEGYDSVTVVNLRRLMQLRRAQGIDQPKPVSAPVTGTRPALLLLVDFSDYSHQAGSTPTIYNDLLFSVGTYPAPGSIRDFYQKVSYGQYDISPTGVDSSWRKASQTRAYYAGSDNGMGTYPNNAQKLVEEAVKLADPYINYASYAIGGEVQGLFVIHAGPGAEASGSSLDIWSHMWALNSHAVSVDGVMANTYSIEPEYVFSPGDSTMGVFAHEYGHVLGLPDLYDTDLFQRRPGRVEPDGRRVVEWSGCRRQLTCIPGRLLPHCAGMGDSSGPDDHCDRGQRPGCGDEPDDLPPLDERRQWDRVLPAREPPADRLRSVPAGGGAARVPRRRVRDHRQ